MQLSKSDDLFYTLERLFASLHVARHDQDDIAFERVHNQIMEILEAKQAN